MQVALTEHPEWQGEWQMPEGVQQIEINPKTGQPATPEDNERRVELFINGTGPGEEDTNLSLESETPEAVDDVPALPEVEAPEPVPSPSTSPRSRSGASGYPDESGRLEGTITLDVDPATGLIAVETCPVVRTRTFVLGTEPRKYCGPEFHRRGAAVDPSSSRPRTVATPPR